MTIKEKQPKNLSDASPGLPLLPMGLQEIFGKPTFSDTAELLGEMAAVLPTLNPEQKILLLGYLEKIIATSETKPGAKK